MTEAIGGWTPLRYKAFRALWLASLGSHIGTWMNDVGTAWVMTDLTRDPLWLSLVGASASLPVFALALPSGALADTVSRKWLLLAAQGWLTIVAGAMAFFTYTGQMTPVLLLIFAASMGLGTAIFMPAWEAIQPELVPKHVLTAALTLDSATINIARAIGPATGGLIVAAVGAWAVFALDAVTFTLLALAVAFAYKRQRSSMEAERFGAALRGGLRYVRHSPPFKLVLLRTAAFIILGTSLWALLANLARFELGLGSLGYGLLVGVFGTGAVATALLLPRIRARVSIDRISVAATVGMAVLLGALALAPNAMVLAPIMLLGGASWIGQMSSLNVSAQLATADWARGRALSMYVLTFQGGMFLGALGWGTLASSTSVRLAYGVAAAGMAASVGLALARPLGRVASMDHMPALHWPTPRLVTSSEVRDRPVMVTIDYEIRTEQNDAFVEAAHELRRLRLRDGAYDWGLYQDPEKPGFFMETFRIASWQEHLRQHERFTVSDLPVEQRVKGFHVGPEPPRVRHLLAPDPPPRGRVRDPDP